MKITIKVNFTDAAGAEREDTVTTSLSTVVAWERHFKRKASDMASGIGIEDISFLAWHRLSGLKREGRPFDEWLEGVVDLEVLESADGGPPTKPDTSGAN